MKQHVLAVLLVLVLASCIYEASAALRLNHRRRRVSSVASKAQSDLVQQYVANSPLHHLDFMCPPDQTHYYCTPDHEVNYLCMYTTKGRVVVKLRPDVAPLTVDRVKTLVRQGFYDNKPWHRVIPGNYGQTGAANMDGTGGSNYTLNPEFSNLRHTRGAVSMSHVADGNNNSDSQFFIMMRNAPELNGKYTVFGEVATGIEAVDSLAGCPHDSMDGLVANPDFLQHVSVACDDKYNQDFSANPGSY
eukprot:gnl/Hemi2/540_TR191_c0_g3_i1.p1 gnl/Hemi2/540_TR191_c0_g3~~gnl/Hemi2/540_TR191_c0_g3_i1.p1  ORF type:complete len:261 (-),score=108.03 gnl/Hemi2/540_TR191_c0_g3_i1:277-1014(-)